MTSQDCTDQAATCDAHAAKYGATPMAADWAQMAQQWRLLAADGDASGTLA